MLVDVVGKVRNLSIGVAVPIAVVRVICWNQYLKKKR